jgi:hypothetical protein
MNQLPTPNPSKNTIYTNKNFRTSCKMTYKKINMIQVQGMSTYAVHTDLLTSSALSQPHSLTLS